MLKRIRQVKLSVKTSVVLVSVVIFLTIGVFALLPKTFAVTQDVDLKSEQRLVTIFDRNQKSVVLTTQTTVAEVLEQAGVEIASGDVVEPSLETELISDKFYINIFRAHSVMLIDGTNRLRVVTPYEAPDLVARAAGVTLYPEDVVTTEIDFLATGGETGVSYVVTRAKLVNFVYYGKATQIRTQGKRVADLLTDKKIKLSDDDRLNLPLDVPVVDGMTLELWREGLQEIAQEEEVAFPVRKIYDFNRNLSYRHIEQTGVVGRRLVTYEVEIKNGEEVTRRELSSITVTEPVEQIEVVGAKSAGGLTKSKGVNHFVDSNGVTHRETYYDLKMNKVMQNCHQGGYYTVREDGVKIDRDGYVIVAAHLGNYPRCSVVETSVGLGKVYDTGGFTTRHPHGFDIATDWSKPDGI
ncbi:MAG: ubiquitin-like domain-containing protein [Candidatus Nanosyncoccaceae bacterium]|jgi:uncharacterized protein YabE (DUF348 family)